MLGHLQLDLCSVLLSHSLNRGRSQLDKDSLLRSVKWFSAPTISRLLLLEVRIFRVPKLPKTYRKIIVGASTMVKRDIMPTDAPICTLMLISPLLLHLPLPVEPILFGCRQAELFSWESQPCCCGGSPRGSKCCHWYVFRQ
jgi:hypothetical protein